MANQQNLTDFLKVASGSKEVGLIIAQNDTELQDFQKTLRGHGFAKVDRTSKLLEMMEKPGKAFLAIQETINKNVYDFIAQYATGQVEVFNPESMKTNVVSPDYKNFLVVVLVTKKNLNDLQSQGFNLLTHAGPAYQS